MVYCMNCNGWFEGYESCPFCGCLTCSVVPGHQLNRPLVEPTVLTNLIGAGAVIFALLGIFIFGGILFEIFAIILGVIAWKQGAVRLGKIAVAIGAICLIALLVLVVVYLMVAM